MEFIQVNPAFWYACYIMNQKVSWSHVLGLTIVHFGLPISGKMHFLILKLSSTKRGDICLNPVLTILFFFSVRTLNNFFGSMGIPRYRIDLGEPKGLAVQFHGIFIFFHSKKVLVFSSTVHRLSTSLSTLERKLKQLDSKLNENFFTL